MNNTIILRFHRNMQKSTEKWITWVTISFYGAHVLVQCSFFFPDQSQYVYRCFMGMDSRTRIFQPIASFLFLQHKHNEQTVNCTGLGLFYTNYYMLFTSSH
ncbi:hypothetical protein EGR_08964 [Echinococcus granulosus]|uniref:Uncharacterized protein n=1 Tax=Echinococcus granulosus TaxID=6210 RepID=W6URW8_ECHGR|nr:hypothetical protein EGR_08964 [Echinococcus granulosus]EUB56159.1 hypothetical protein EGR_08964 [Echinococcus granulosus]